MSYASASIVVGGSVPGDHSPGFELLEVIIVPNKCLPEQRLRDCVVECRSLLNTISAVENHVFRLQIPYVSAWHDVVDAKHAIERALFVLDDMDDIPSVTGDATDYVRHMEHDPLVEKPISKVRRSSAR